MYGGADAQVRAAAAQIAGHRGVDVGIAGVGRTAQQSGGGDQLSGLTIPALRHVVVDPGLLQGMQPSVRAGQALDRS